MNRPPFRLSLVCLAVLVALSGCASVASTAKSTVAAYCAIPTVARATTRAIVNNELAPASIRVACPGEDLAGAVLGAAVGDLAGTAINVPQVDAFVVAAKEAVAVYCALDPSARQINREQVAAAIAPARIEIGCAAPASAPN